MMDICRDILQQSTNIQCYADNDNVKENNVDGGKLKITRKKMCIHIFRHATTYLT